MSSYDEDRIQQILKDSKTIAVVGISDKPERDSYRVAKYLKNSGYEILPVNPLIETWEGQKVFKSLQEIPGSIRVDVVDVFRKSDAVIPIVEESLKLRPKTIWLQEGVISDEGASLAKKNGIQVVMDRCMMKEHHKFHHS